jgi:hypothetical protein
VAGGEVDHDDRVAVGLEAIRDIPSRQRRRARLGGDANRALG